MGESAAGPPISCRARFASSPFAWITGPGARPGRPPRRSRIRGRGTSRATRSGGTTTASCGGGCSGSPTASASTQGPSATGRSSTAPPFSSGPLARDAGLGWIGKHTNLIDPRAGSWFFLGELYTDLPLPAGDTPADHCGRCRACIDACPTGAIVAPYELDARRCIAYLTIEHPGPIPVELRPAVGNRVFGCDDCQLVCPWNRFAAAAAEPGFAPRHDLDRSPLVELFEWDEADFERYTEGSAIRRLGYERWLRNVAVALGNAPTSRGVVNALRARSAHPSALVREHVAWALGRHQPHRTLTRTPAT